MANTYTQMDSLNVMPANAFSDEPKLLRDPAACDSRRLQLSERHVAPLAEFVQKLRKQVPNGLIPDFDPWDGGIDAEVLYLLEAPGARARDSGFISRNNPDETAKNFRQLNIDAGIPRKRTICWNVVPWYIGSGKKIRAAKSSEVRDGLRPLFELLHLLPNLRAIVLIGRKSEYAALEIQRQRPDLKLFKTPHPSPMYCNRAVGNKQHILDALQPVAEFLLTQPAVQL